MCKRPLSGTASWLGRQPISMEIRAIALGGRHSSNKPSQIFISVRAKPKQQYRTVIAYIRLIDNFFKERLNVISSTPHCVHTSRRKPRYDDCQSQR
ncbi:hypothetical protein, partial [Caballeronia calidae]|uniref:hypothetical protein n=1 Tax=Caballeronia calidae TaxID=1777139 RepID=UPI001E29065C